MGRLGLVNHVRIENVELVALDSLGRRIVDVVVLLVVLIPVVAGVDAVVVAGLPWPVLVRPRVGLIFQLELLGRGHFGL